jgi:hypothetical protein
VCVPWARTGGPVIGREGERTAPLEKRGRSRGRWVLTRRTAAPWTEPIQGGRERGAHGGGAARRAAARQPTAACKAPGAPLEEQGCGGLRWQEATPLAFVRPQAGRHEKKTCYGGEKGPPHRRHGRRGQASLGIRSDWEPARPHVQAAASASQTTAMRPSADQGPARKRPRMPSALLRALKSREQ